MTCLSYTSTVRYMKKHASLMSISSALIVLALVTYINHVYRADNVELSRRSAYVADLEKHSQETHPQQTVKDSGNQHENIYIPSTRKSVPSNIPAAVDIDVDDRATLNMMRGEPLTTTIDANVTRMLDAFTLRRQLPNYFIHGNASGLAKKYRSGNVVFVHNVKTGGTTVKNSIVKMCRDRNIPTFLISSKNRMDMFKKYETHGGTPSQTILAGDATIGICDILRGRPCSYFTMVREPVARMVSSYLFCKQRGAGCGKSSVNVPLNAWSLYFGSKLFNSLFQNFGVHFPLGGARARFQHRSAEFRAFAERLQQDFPDIVTGRELGYRMTSNERHAFLNYCLDNMENWFAVIGLTEDFDASIDLYQEVYRLPFRDYYQGAMNIGRVKEKMDPSNIDKMKEDLRANPLIMEALYEDLKIYEKAEEIMEKQKQTFGRF